MTERRTSAAKDYMTPETQSLLETYGVARNHFEHARDPTISQQHKDLAREQALEKAREERGSILANGGYRLPEYSGSADKAHQNTNEQRGSQMVQNDRPENNMRPPEKFAKAVDRETFDKKWFEEQLRAERANDAREQDRGHDREPER